MPSGPGGAHAAWLPLAVVLALAGCGVDRSSTSASRQPLVGGNVDDGGFPEVVALRLSLVLADGGADFKHCSGTLITPTVVLTAAHCTTGLLLPGATLVAMEVQPGTPVRDAGWTPVDSWRAHASWNTSVADRYDIGAVKLSAPLPGLTPRPFSRLALTQAHVGRPMDVVGYGVTSSGATDFGTRRFVRLPLRGLTPTLIELGDFTDAGICSGDSGGPSILVEDDGVGRVVGVHSRTVPGAGCRDGVDTRVDQYTGFVTQFLQDTGGASCVEDGLCATGCASPDVDCVCAADGQCTAQCPNLLSDPDCPRDCVANGVCAAQSCPVADADCTPELSPCTADDQCQHRSCANDVSRGERYCTRPCTAGCPAGTVCEGAVCLKSLPAVGPGDACAPGASQCPQGTTCTGWPGDATRCLTTCASATDCQAQERCEPAQGGVSLCRALGDDAVRGGCASAPGAMASLAFLLLGWAWRRR